MRREIVGATSGFQSELNCGCRIGEIVYGEASPDQR
jgi:hypothetical protein